MSFQSSNPPGPGQLKEIRSLLKNTKALFLTAGAGMGVDSGLPDFRGAKGFWKAYPEAEKRGLQFQDLANPRWFRTDPEMAWAFYGHRLHLYRDTDPHSGFSLLKEFAEKREKGYFVFTSNVDGQFQKAGFDSHRIEECHGSIHHLQCLNGCGRNILEAGGVNISIDRENFRALPPLPVCEKCGALLRPNILMFGDGGWIPDRTEDQHERLSDWIDGLRMTKVRPVILEIGAGTSVPTVRMMSERVAALTGGTLIRLNPREPEVPAGHSGLPLGGKEGILKLLEE